MAVPARRPDDPVPGIGPLPPDPRKIVEARAGDLFIDRNAQRDLDGERVAQIAQEFDWRRFEMPTCSRLSDGRLRVVEGQHRVSAVVLRDPNTILRVLELDEGLTLAEEAGLGLAITAKRRIHSAYAKWELRVRRGDAHEIAAQEVLRAHGLRLGTKTSPTAIACVSVVDHLIHANRQTPEMGAETLDTALRVIEIAYPRDEPDSAATRWNRDLLKAVSALVLRNPTLDVSRLAGALRDRIAQQWITQAKAIDAPAWAVIAQSLADRYNKGLRNQSRRIGLDIGSPIDFDALYEPPTAEQEDALRDDIRANGVLQPVLVTPGGAIVAGRTRKRLAAELGVPCPTAVFEGSIGEALRVAVLDNPQRKVRHEHRKAAIALLREQDWSYRRIADCIGVSERTVRNDYAAWTTAETSAVGQAVGKDNRRRPGRRLTPEERRRRRAAVARLYNAGYAFEAIGEALGINKTTASSDARFLGLSKPGRRRAPGLDRDVPPSIDWRSEPTPTSPPDEASLVEPSRQPAYRTSPVVADALHWIEGFDGGDYPNRFAWNLAEAEAGSDETWLAYARDLIERAHDQFGRLVRVLNDEAYRDQCQRGHGDDVRTRSSDSPPELRVIR